MINMSDIGQVTDVQPQNGNSKAIIHTATGGFFNYDNPEESEITIMDIAHALSNIPRFCGHTMKFYSVAEHSHMCVEYLRKLVEESEVGGEKLVISYETYMATLLHDAAEAFMSDIPRPFKHRIPQIADEEKKILSTIITKLELDLDEADWGLVKRADNYMLMLEARNLMAPARRFRYVWGPWLAREHDAVKEMMDDDGSAGEMWITGFDNNQAMQVFIEEYNKIRWSKV
jgi:hypothetical protein